MKHIVAGLLFLVVVPVLAQSTDEELVRAACKDYVEGFYRADSARIGKSVDHRLVKRIVNPANGRFQEMTLQQLKEAAASHPAPQDDVKTPFEITVNVFDITKDIAIAKITTNKMPFFDYAQLARINGKWKVVNVLWAMNK